MVVRQSITPGRGSRSPDAFPSRLRAGALLVGCFLALTPLAARAASAVIFGNYLTNASGTVVVDAPVTDGKIRLGRGYVAAFAASTFPTITRPLSGSSVPFVVGPPPLYTGTGYVLPQTNSSGLAVGTRLYVRMFAWHTNFASFTDALDGGGKCGQSAIISVLTGSAIKPAYLAALDPFTVGVRYPPSVSLTSPADGASFAVGENVPLVAGASDSDDTVTSVRFYDGGTLLVTDSTAPYEASVSNLSSGWHQLTAVATDTYNLRATSAPPVNVYVGFPPFAQLTEPADAAIIAAPGPVHIVASASDSDGTVARVDFYVDGELRGTDTEPPYSYDWLDAPQGTYTLLAIATDNGGLVGASPSVNIRISERPTVSIAAPAEAAFLNIPGASLVDVVAADTDSDVAQIELLVDGSSLQTLVAPPFSFSWTPATPGVHTLQAVATDGYGLTAASAVRGVQVLGPPIFAFETDSYNVWENGGSVILTVRKSTFSRLGFVNFVTEQDTAHAEVNGVGDFPTTYGSLSFDQADLAKTIEIPIRNDSSYEGDQTFRVLLASPSEGSLGDPNRATVVIKEDDPPWTTNSVVGIAFPSSPTAGSGQLEMWIQPAAALGQWRLAWDLEWHGSGHRLAGLVPGNYEIEFRPMLGYIQPPNVKIDVPDGALTSVTNYYIASSQPERSTLTVTLQPGSLATETDPNKRAQWKLQGETNWRNSGTVAADLPIGSYLIECKTLTGYAAPASRMVTVVAGQGTEIALAYEIIDATGGVVTPQALPSFNALGEGVILGRPYVFCGQLVGDAGYGSGIVVREHVVLTAAHMLFDDAKLQYVANIRWLFERHRGEYEPLPQLPRGWYVFDGYATQRMLDDSPGVATLASQKLDAGVLYFREGAGRGGYSGYLVSEPGPAGTEWLTLAFANKMLIGYPVDHVPETNRGRMHFTAPIDVTFDNLGGRVFATTGIQSYPGNSGGPLCVLVNTNDTTRYIPAAVYLGGGSRTVVRAIDGAVAELINQAELIADTGDTNYAGGGVSRAPTALGTSPFEAGYLRVTLGPAAAATNGAAWRVVGSGNPDFFASEGDLPLLAAGYTVEFLDAPGYLTPTNRPVEVHTGQTAVLNVDYEPIRIAFAPPAVVTGGNLRLTVPLTPGLRYLILTSTNLTEWEPLATSPDDVGATWEFVDPGISNRPLRFYRGRTE